jgi:hypothetical protein
LAVFLIKREEIIMGAEAPGQQETQDPNVLPVGEGSTKIYGETVLAVMPEQLTLEDIGPNPTIERARSIVKELPKIDEFAYMTASNRFLP